MDDYGRNEFCKDTEQEKCRCKKTDGFKPIALHIEKIIEMCKDLPLQHEDNTSYTQWVLGHVTITRTDDKSVHAVCEHK